MTVFKYYFKIVRKHLGSILFYAAISIGIAIVNTSYSAPTEYAGVTSDIAIIDHDDSNLTHNFKKYIGEKTNIKEVNDDKRAIQDALYNKRVDSILIIPENFEKDLFEGKNPNVEIKKSAESLSTTVELMVNRYFGVAATFHNLGMDDNTVFEKTAEDLNKETETKMDSSAGYETATKLAVFYSYENYAFLAILIFVIGTIMCIFNDPTISKRNAISKLTSKSLSRQLFLANACLALIVWAAFCIISVAVYGDAMFSGRGLCFVLTSLVFIITCTSMAFLVGSLIKNRNVLSGVQNTITLGLSFISGCFVDASLLGDGVIAFSKLFPSYWFIDTNYKISKLTEFNWATLSPVVAQTAVVAAFGVGYFVISRIIIKKHSHK